MKCGTRLGGSDWSRPESRGAPPGMWVLPQTQRPPQPGPSMQASKQAGFRPSRPSEKHHKYLEAEVWQASGKCLKPRGRPNQGQTEARVRPGAAECESHIPPSGGQAVKVEVFSLMALWLA